MCQMCDDGEKASAGQEMTAPAAEPAKMPVAPEVFFVGDDELKLPGNEEG